MEVLIKTVGELKEVISNYSEETSIQIATNRFSTIIDGYIFDVEKNCLYLFGDVQNRCFIQETGMDTLQILKEINNLADFDKCGIDDIPEKDYEAYKKHREICAYCNARETMNNISEEIFFFHKKFLL